MADSRVEMAVFTTAGQAVITYKGEVTPRVGEYLTLQQGEYRVKSIRHQIHKTEGLLCVALYVELANQDEAGIS